MASLDEYLVGLDSRGNELDPARVAEYRLKHSHKAKNVVVPVETFLALPERSSDLVVVSMAVGREANQLKAINWARTQNYAARCRADSVCIESVESAYPMLGKFCLGQFFDHGYKRLMFLDIDAVVDDNCPDVFAEISSPLAMFDDRPLLHSDQWYEDECLSLAKSQRHKFDTTGMSCFNTGVIVASAESALAFAMPFHPFPKSHTAEQTLIGMNIIQHCLQCDRLTREWNEQWWPNRRMADNKAHVRRWSNASHVVRMREMPAACGVEWSTSMPSRGLGDTIAKFTHATGIEAVAKIAAKAVGASDCGCNKRQQVANNLLPYHSRQQP